jgi:hypothetical protein
MLERCDELSWQDARNPKQATSQRVDDAGGHGRLADQPSSFQHYMFRTTKLLIARFRDYFYKDPKKQLTALTASSITHLTQKMKA